MSSSAVWFSASSLDVVSTVLASPGPSFKDLADGTKNIVTTLVAIIGGIWAYFKFVRGRTYRPRLSVDVAGQWLKLDGARPRCRRISQLTRWQPAADSGRNVFYTRIRVTNIGASKVSLKQYGTGLTISFPAQEQPEPPSDFEWEYVPKYRGDVQPQTFEILKQHAWIEPGETVSDDLLLDLDRSPRTVRLEVYLIWGPSRRRRRGAPSGGHDDFGKKDIRVFSRRIIPLDETMTDKVMADKVESR
jgi:hypothetical protein